MGKKKAAESQERSYHLLVYDGDGAPSDGGTERDKLVSMLKSGTISDVHIMSHGWQTNKSDAYRQYDLWTAAMKKQAGAGSARGNALVIGIHWPSKPFLGEDETTGEALLGSSGGSRQGRLVDGYAQSVGASNSSKEAIKTLLSHRFLAIGEEPLLGAGVTTGVELPSAEELKASAELERLTGMAPASLLRIPELCHEFLITVGSEFADAVGKMLKNVNETFLNLLSFYSMKERAGVIGQKSLYPLLVALSEAAPKARIHLMGHSFGCIVVSAALAEGTLSGKRKVTVHSLSLIQGALSKWSYCSEIPVGQGDAGEFVGALDCVEHGIFATQSRRDTAVCVWYPLAMKLKYPLKYIGQFHAYQSLGDRGARGLGVSLCDQVARTDKSPVVFKKGVIYNVDMTKQIKNGKWPSGAHCDIANQAVAHMVRAASAP